MTKKIIFILFSTLTISSIFATYSTIEQINQSDDFQQLITKLSIPKELPGLILGTLNTINKIQITHARIVKAETTLKEAQEKATGQRTKESLKALAEITAAGAQIISLGMNMITYKKQLIQLINFTRTRIKNITRATENQLLAQELSELNHHLHIVVIDLEHLLTDFEAKKITQRIDQLTHHTKILAAFTQNSSNIRDLLNSLTHHEKMKPIIHHICVQGKPLIDEITVTAQSKQLVPAQHPTQQWAMANKLKNNSPVAHEPNATLQ